MTFPAFPSYATFFSTLVFVVCFHIYLAARIQPGIFYVNLVSDTVVSAADGKIYNAEVKSIFTNTSIKLSIQSNNSIDKDQGLEYTLGWELRYTQCEELYGTKITKDSLEELFEMHSYMFSVENYINVQYNTPKKFFHLTEEEYFGNSSQSVCYVVPAASSAMCEKGVVVDMDEPQTEGDDTKTEGDDTKPAAGETAKTEGDDTKPAAGETAKQRKRREEKPPAEEEKNKNKPQKIDLDEVARNEESGSHLIIIELVVLKGSITNLTVKVDMKGQHGYLSAFQYPLLKFYGIMCGLYILLGFTWLFLMFYQYKDLLGIQIWIGAVIFLGLVEKAVFFAEYEHVNNNGYESTTGILFPELVSCLKRTLARLLVVVVSIGYGITRPRLGNDLNYVMAAGMLYMVLSSAEAIMRTSNTYERNMAAILPLSVLDAVLVWWIFRNLVDTTRTLRLRQNDVKLWLYRHFTNTLLLCIVLSIIYFLWSIKTHRYNECITKWHELWLDDAFWHILFCVILVAVMVLFRPSVNNQRYAYSPLIDEEDQDEESKEPMLSDAYDGMKMRNLKKDNAHNAVNDIADDLKWVEDNIPAAIADTALSMMDDSEEELVTNLERSKMD